MSFTTCSNDHHLVHDAFWEGWIVFLVSWWWRGSAGLHPKPTQNFSLVQQALLQKCSKWCTNTEWLSYHLQVCFRQSRSWFGIYPLTLKVFTKSSSTIVLGKPISASRKCIKQSSIPIFKLDRELDLRTDLMVESQISNAPQKYFTAGSETKSLSMPS
jgi:hypothetical protein